MFHKMYCDPQCGIFVVCTLSDPRGHFYYQTPAINKQDFGSTVHISKLYQDVLQSMSQVLCAFYQDISSPCLHIG